jgi:DNA-binding CsgD family transcriptional regulator
MADKLATAKSRSDLWGVATGFLPQLGLRKVVFHDLTDPTAPEILSNARPGWTKAYSANVAAGHDPFARTCLSRVDPVLTCIEHVKDHAYLDRIAREHIAEGSAELGVRTGLSVTLQPDRTGAGVGWNLMTELCVAEFAELRQQREAEWRAWCQLTCAGLSMAFPRDVTPVLSPREYDCLSLIADGYRTADIIHKLGIAEGTVEKHIRNAREKLNAKTRDQAVAIAVRSRLI